jgi:hypothetical protein
LQREKLLAKDLFKISAQQGMPSASEGVERCLGFLILGACAWVALMLILPKSLRKVPNLRFWHKPFANLKTSDGRISEDDRVSETGRVLEDGRVAKPAEELELMITEAVKAAPGCEAFVGVIIQRITPKSRLEANWELRGIRFGAMDRQIAREALIPIVERTQREFRLTEGPIKNLRKLADQ